MSSRKFDITEAFIQALQEQQLKELADKRQEARSHKECDNKTHQICQDIKNKQNKKVTEDIDEENSLNDIANYIKGIVDYNVTITPTGNGFSSYDVNFLNNDDSIMYSVAVNNDTIKDKVGLLNTLVLELNRLYRGKTFADIIREDLLNELNKIHPVNKTVTEATMLAPRGKSNKVRVSSIKGRNKKLKESIETNSKEGTCPVCHSDNIEYTSFELDDYGVKYPFICNSCGAQGDEFYDMTFSEIRDNYTDESSKNEGICPKCGSDLDYGILLPDGMDIYYEVECPQCDFVGKEWYDLSFAGQEIKNKKQEARSHKEDNEKAAPRTKLNKNGKEVRTRNMVDVSNPAVGNNSYKNQKGNQYWGTTNSEYASKRNKTGKKNEYGNDVYLADYDDMQNPVKDFQNIKRDIKSQEDTRDFYDKKRRRTRSQDNYEYYTKQKEYMNSEIDKSNQKATDIVNKEQDRIQNKERRGLGEYKEIEKQDKPLTENSMDKNLKLTLKDEISAEFYNELNEQLTTTLTAKIMDKYNVKSGDIAPEQAVKADELIKELSDLYADVVMQNM